mgnify:FL=1
MYVTGKQRIKNVKVNPHLRKKNAKKPKGKVLDYNELQRIKEERENRLVRKIF